MNNKFSPAAQSVGLILHYPDAYLAPKALELPDRCRLASEITAEAVEEELCVLHDNECFGPANIGTMQAQTAKWREK